MNAATIVAIPTWAVATLLPLVATGVGSLLWIAYRLGTFARMVEAHDARLDSHSRHLDAADDTLVDHGERIVRLETHARVGR